MQKMVKIALSFEQAGFRNTIGMMQHALMKLNQFVKCDDKNNFSYKVHTVFPRIVSAETILF